MSIRKKSIAWGQATLLAASYLAYELNSKDQRLFLPGITSAGHYQIEKACDVCHGKAFQGEEALEKSCIKCHAKELKAMEDSHSKKLFVNPRYINQTKLVDATRCITCHQEHKPDITRDEGVTVAKDFCFLCHDKIGQERKSHRGLVKNGCADAGCHKYHDNRSLYEDFLLKHLDEPDILPVAKQPQRNHAEIMRELSGKTIHALTAAAHNAPQNLTIDKKLLRQWERSSHADGAINCKECHAPNKALAWKNKPDSTACKRCHKAETNGFLTGKHGMRLAQSLPAMVPAEARRAMKKDAPAKHPGCMACHKTHDFNTRRAAVDACLICHNDKHSLAYKKSAHFTLWEKEEANSSTRNNGSGVSCATCHLPREKQRFQGKDVIRVQHNQNDNLRPSEKMIRSVCLNCHGLAFSIDSLADANLVQRNFSGRPARHVKSIDMARDRSISKLIEKPKEMEN